MSYHKSYYYQVIVCLENLKYIYRVYITDKIMISVNFLDTELI